MKTLSNRLISLLLTLLMVMSLFTILPNTVLAATAMDLHDYCDSFDEGLITVTYDGAVNYDSTQNGKWYWVATNSGVTSASATGSMTITNNSYNKVVTLKGNYGMSKIPNIDLTFDPASAVTYTTGATMAKRTLSIVVNPKSTVTLNMKVTSLNIVISLDMAKYTIETLDISSCSINVNSAEHGTVSSEQLTAAADGSLSGDIDLGGEVTVTAQPDEGYEFYGFSDGDNWFGSADDPSYTFEVVNNTELTPLFLPVGSPLYAVGPKRYTDLRSAVAAAASGASGGNVIMLRNDTLTDTSESYVIPSNVQLIIPHAAGDKSIMTEPEFITTYTTPSYYATLTLAPGVVMDVNGTLSVNAAMKPAANGKNGPTCAVGHISLSPDAQINLYGSATMYAWGYVTGEGTVDAYDSSTVVEEMQISDFRGGNATFMMHTEKQQNKGCFPFNQYYIQNIESRVTIHYGAMEKVGALLNAGGATAMAFAEFFGSGTGVFKLGAGSSVSKWYDAETDKLYVEVDGDGELSNLTLNVLNMANIDSVDYILPLNNMQIIQKSGTLTTHQKVSLMPDSSMIIREGAKAIIGSDSAFYVYDADDLGSYNIGATIVPLSYSPSLGGASTRAVAGMQDSYVQVDGTLEIEGIFNTTQNGANVTSTNPKQSDDDTSYGRVILHNKDVGEFYGPYQASNTIVGYDEVPITPAVLRNSNGTYRPTVARNEMDAEFYYVDLQNITDANGDQLSVWVSDKDPDYFTVVWQDKDGNELQRKEHVKNTELAVTEYTGEDISSYRTYSETDPTVVTKFNDFIGWESEYDSVNETLYYKPRYKQFDAVTLNWRDNNLITTTYIRKLDKITSADIPTDYINQWSIQNKSGSGVKYLYNGFTGSIKAIDGSSLSITQSSGYRINESVLNLYITWKEVADTTVHTVTWKNADGTVLATEEYFNTQYPTYKGDEPTSDSDTAAFYGWKTGSTTYEKSKTLPKVTKDLIFTAVYKEKKKVTWQNWDGAVLKEDYYPTGALAANVSYDGDTPTRPADAQYTYKFSGWEPEISNVTGDMIYTAQYKTFLNSYTITWKDGDAVLGYDTFYYGATPAYNGTPTKADDETFTYTFAGWSPEIEPVQGEAVYTASYNKQLINNDGYHFTVNSISLNGTIGVNFYFEAASIEDLAVKFTYHGVTEVVAVTAEMYDSAQSAYKITKPVNAPEMTDEVQAELVVGDTVCDTKSYKVADYIGVKNPTYDNLVDCYIVGTIFGKNYWPDPDTNEISDHVISTYQMHLNPANDTEYMLENVELAAGDEIKCFDGVNYFGDSLIHGQNVTVDTTGVYTVYCKVVGDTREVVITPQEKSDNLVPLLRAMANYGADARKQFPVDGDDALTPVSDYISRIPDYATITDEMLNARIGGGTASADDLYEVDLSGTGLSYFGSSLVLNSGTVLRHYFKIEDEAVFNAVKDSVTFGGKAAEVKYYTRDPEAAGYVYFELDIPAAELDELKVLNIGGTEMKFSALDYAKRALEMNRSDLTEIMTALYWYNLFADAYFPQA